MVGTVPGFRGGRLQLADLVLPQWPPPGRTRRGPVRLSYNPYISAFSQNSVFPSQQISWNDVSVCFFSEANGTDDCISLYLELVHGGQHHHPPHTDPVQFKFSLLDQAGDPVPGYSRSKELCAFWLHPPSGPIPTGSTTAPIGFDGFVKWKDLHESGALKDDRFAIRCDITAIRDWHGWLLAARSRIPVPSSGKTCTRKQNQGFFYRPKFTEISEISFLSIGSDKI